MDTNTTGGAAFPITKDAGYQTTLVVEYGMTLLDYFAAKILPTILQSLRVPYSEEDMQKAARMSYTQAAAMIEERKNIFNLLN